MTFRMIVQLWNTNTLAFVSCDADLTENYMYISMKFGTGVHVFCWEVGVFNRSSFQSVSYNWFCRKRLPQQLGLNFYTFILSQVLHHCIDLNETSICVQRCWKVLRLVSHFQITQKLVSPNDIMHWKEFDIPLVQMKFCSSKPFGLTNFSINVWIPNACLDLLKPKSRLRYSKGLAKDYHWNSGGNFKLLFCSWNCVVTLAKKLYRPGDDLHVHMTKDIFCLYICNLVLGMALPGTKR